MATNVKDPGFRQNPQDSNVEEPKPGLNPCQRPGWAQQQPPNWQAPHKPGATTTNPIPASAMAILGPLLAQFGLQSLLQWAWTRYKQLGGGQDAVNIINFELPQQEAFRERFP